MLCQSCGQKTATTHLKRNINGKVTELHLCADCAKEQGLTSIWNGAGFGIDDFWGSLFSEPTVRLQADGVRCEGCGKSFSEIAQSGKPGCPTCYTTFYDRLLPSIQRIHGKAKHVGKFPSAVDEQYKQEQELQRLKDELAKSVAAQEYEKCAELRDRIKALEEAGRGEES